MQRDSQALEAKRAFGLFFIAVSVAIVIGTVLSEVAAKYNAPIADIVLIWLASFGVTFGANFRKFRRVIVLVKISFLQLPLKHTQTLRSTLEF